MHTDDVFILHARVGGLHPNFVNFLSQVEWRPRRAKFRERCVAAHTSGPRKTACLLKIPVERCSWPTPNIYFDRITHLSRMHAARAPASRFLGDDACDEQMLPCLAHSARRLLLRPVVCRALPPVLAVSVGTAIHSSFASQTLCMWQPPERRRMCGGTWVMGSTWIAQAAQFCLRAGSLVTAAILYRWMSRKSGRRFSSGSASCACPLRRSGISIA